MRNVVLRAGWLAGILAWGGACDNGGGAADVADHGADGAVAEDAGDADAPDVDAGFDGIADGAPGDGDGDAGCRFDVSAPCTPPSTACQGEACHAAPYAPTCVSGTVTDEHGAPLYCQPVAACAGVSCFSAHSDANGYFAVALPAGMSVSSVSLYFPALTPRISPFCTFEALCDGAVHLCNEFRLFPSPTTGEDVGAWTPDYTRPALAADVRVTAADGGALIFSAGDAVLLPVDATETTVALTRFPLAEHVPCFIDPANLPLALYAVTPLDTYVIEPGTDVAPVLRSAALDLPNETGLGADAVVDVYVLGGAHGLAAGMDEAEWQAVTTATVTADGTRIQTAPGAGLGYLTWFAIFAR